MKPTKEEVIKLAEKRLEKIKDFEFEITNLREQIYDLNQHNENLKLQNKKLTRIIVEINAEKYIK